MKLRLLMIGLCVSEIAFGQVKVDSTLVKEKQVIAPLHELEVEKEKKAKVVTSEVGSGEYSGITYIGGTQYAVVHDHLDGGGLLLFDIHLNSKGTVEQVSKTVPTGTLHATAKHMDNEGVAYVPSTGTVFVSAESDQSIREYTLDGVPTGRALVVPEDMAADKIVSNRGFEALTYNAKTGMFWTTTESELVADAATPGLLRLQSFGNDLKPHNRYLYQMDAPTKSRKKIASASKYVLGVSDMAALDDGRLVVLEREVYVPKGSKLKKALSAFTKMKLYVVHPEGEAKSPLKKTLLRAFRTSAVTLANYEGICVGPVLPDGCMTFILIPDSQDGAHGLTQEYLKVILVK